MVLSVVRNYAGIKFIPVVKSDELMFCCSQQRNEFFFASTKVIDSVMPSNELM